jgi:lysophospholipase L1-like esterase
MKKLNLIMIIILILLLAFNCQRIASTQQNLCLPDNPNIHYTGRIDFSNPKSPKLSGAGACFKMKFRGSDCEILLEDQNLYDNHNYISVVIDGKYQGRMKVSKDQTKYPVAENLNNADHTLLICKATEAQIGYIEFSGISCSEILPFKNEHHRKIEFIGNSITCGMGMDTSGIPCGAGTWYDQHNAYLAYGPLIARELNADWLLSSVSGIGMTRNWNSPGPAMPEVYQNLYLNTDSTIAWNAGTYIPDLISICLGTNDFSDGDGSYQRAALDSVQFVNRYFQFVKYIRSRSPQAQICCLTSPAISGEKGIKLKNYLSAVIQHLQKTEKNEKVSLFVFSRNYSSGCTGHPDKEEHQMMAEELLPFFKKVMGW